MYRLFQTHEIRIEKELDGLWEFEPLEQVSSQPNEYKYSMTVPGCWETHPDFLTYRGVGAYRRKIYVSKDANLQLLFKGVSHTADVYFDGKWVIHHYNAYTPFNVIIPNVQKGSHEIMVIVDNRFSEASSLHIPNDYYTYGGITRPVVLQEIQDCYIHRVEFTPILENNSWKANIRIYTNTLSEGEKRVHLKGNLAEMTLDFGETVIFPEKENIIEKQFDFPDVEPWSNHTPNLYLLKISLFCQNDLIDDYIERVGFRVVKVDRQRLLLNGESIFLKGFNRHEDHPITGCAIPFPLMVYDMNLMADMGGNMVRTCHYPNDELFLDLCDERGFLVWEENHARGLDEELMKTAAFDKQCEDCNREMVENHYNHPSIIIWGILNECESASEAGRYQYAKQFEQIRSMDQSRPLTFATCRHFSDICLDLVDIVSINIYHQWYQNIDAYEAYMSEKQWIDSTGGRGKPIIISEFGAGAIYGYRTPTRVKWSEERQAQILEDTLSVYLKQDGVIGTIIWQFCDCRVTEENWSMVRPRTMNNKGIVDEYRRPKLSYAVVQKFYKV